MIPNQIWHSHLQKFLLVHLEFYSYENNAPYLDLPHTFELFNYPVNEKIKHTTNLPLASQTFFLSVVQVFLRNTFHPSQCYNDFISVHRLQKNDMIQFWNTTLGCFFFSFFQIIVFLYILINKVIVFVFHDHVTLIHDGLVC